MSTANFYHGNTSNIFAVLMSNTCNDEFGFDDLKSCIAEKLSENLDNTALDTFSTSHKQNFDRNFQGSHLYDLNTQKTFGDMTISIEVSMILREAYYDGASLDYDLSFSTDWSDDFESYEDAVTEAAYQSDMNAGLKVIQSRNIEEWVSVTKDALIELTEKIFGEVSTPLNIAGIFSNGEAVYSKA